MKYIAFTLALAGMCLAAPLAGHAAQTHNGTQTHKSGQASGAAAAKPRHNFETCDTDKDGFLSKEEYLACWPRGAAKFAAIDKDHDGMVSRDDVKTYRAERRAARQAGGTSHKPGAGTHKTQE